MRLAGKMRAIEKIALGGAIAALVATLAYLLIPAQTDRSGWTEKRIDWLTPEPWAASRAFECSVSTCGKAVTLLVQAKVGLCNCETGIADDDTLERMSDLPLIGKSHEALAPGHDIAVGGMSGRSRPYRISDSAQAAKSALALAYNDRCDMVVATAMTRDERAADVEQAVLAFLGTDPIKTWVETKLGL